MNDIHPFQLTLTSGNGKVPEQVAYSVHLGLIRWRIATSLPTLYKINLKKWNLAAVHSWIFISFYFVIFSHNRRQNFGTGAAEEHSFLSNYRFTCTIFTNKITLFTNCKHRHHLNCRTTANFFKFFQSVRGLHETWSLEFCIISLMTNISGKQFIRRSFLLTKEKNKQKSHSLSCILVI